MSPFDIVNDVCYNKVNLSLDPEFQKAYVPFIINRALSYHQDTLYYANEMNINHNLDKDMQNSYLLHATRKRKRFAKWHKSEEDQNIVLIQQYYNCNYNRAREYASILTTKQLKEIAKTLEKGTV